MIFSKLFNSMKRKPNNKEDKINKWNKQLKNCKAKSKSIRKKTIKITLKVKGKQPKPKL